MFRLTLLCLLFLAGRAHAQPLLDPANMPRLPEAGRAAFREFLTVNLPRSFAMSRNGASGYFGGGIGGTIESARTKALESCAAKGGTDCAPYAENLDLVWPGLVSQTAAPPPALLSTSNYEAVPDNRYFWRGPASAAGVYVWAHGTGTLNGAGATDDARGQQPQSHVRAFNNGGFDIVRFDRQPNADRDRDRAAGWLEDILLDLRHRGYRRIVVGGQSRGGWNALQMLRTRGLADVVIAVSPAAHGSGGSTNLSAQYDDLRQIVAGAEPGPARLAFVQFAADPFAGDLAGRVTLIERLRAKLGGLLILDQPDGFSGHFGGATSLFARNYAECLFRFASEAVPRRAC